MAIEREEAVRVLMRDHDRLSAYAWVIVRDDQIVEDVLQEVALLLIEKHPEITSNQHLAGWLRTACRNKALEAIRARQRHPTLLSNEALDLLDVNWQRLEVEAEAFHAQALQHCLQKLTPRSRQILELRHIHNLKSGEIAAKLSRKVETIYVGLMRIHATLADCIKAILAPETTSHG
jgi:RNA polymerase sigma-70 factor (ECF subfamily)